MKYKFHIDYCTYVPQATIASSGSCFLWHYIANLTTTLTLPRVHVLLECVDRFLELGTQIDAMEGLFVDLGSAILAIPPQPVQGLGRSFLLQDDANGIGEPDRVVGSVCRKQKHITFVDMDVPELVGGRIDGFKEHGSLILIEPLSRLIDMIVGSRIWTAHNLGGRSVYCSGLLVFASGIPSPSRRHYRRNSC
jgi:hypothetical protein